MVRAPEVRVGADVHRDRDQLRHRVPRVLPAGSGQPLGIAAYFAPQPKGVQDLISLVVFAVFSTTCLGQSLKWNHWANSALISVAARLIFLE